MRTNGRTDRYTGMVKLIVDVRNFSNVPEYSTFNRDYGLIVKVRLHTLIKWISREPGRHRVPLV